MIYKKGDLLEAFRQGEVECVGHGCNIRCRMASGIARQVALEFPEAAIADAKTLSGDIRKMGSITYALTKHGYIFNIYQQEFYGTHQVQIDYPSLEKGLEKVNAFMDKNKITTIGLPKIGAGLAGGDWSVISDIIDKTLATKTVTIYEL